MDFGVVNVGLLRFGIALASSYWLVTSVAAASGLHIPTFHVGF